VGECSHPASSLPAATTSQYRHGEAGCSHRSHPWSPGKLISHPLQHPYLIGLPCGPGVRTRKAAFTTTGIMERARQTAALHTYFQRRVQPVDENVSRTGKAAMGLVCSGETEVNKENSQLLSGGGPRGLQITAQSTIHQGVLSASDLQPVQTCTAPNI